MKSIKSSSLFVLSVFVCCIKMQAQLCGSVQSLTALQQSQIAALAVQTDSALKHEDLFHIDSLSTEIKNTYALQGGLPDAAETYYPLTASTAWLNMNDALVLSRVLIAADSAVYADLWKAAKGMNPPLYNPHSLFLRAPAEIAAGLLKIAAYETDVTRKALYQSWATRALDSLATMQLPSGAFPFPDLRTWGDPVFGPIIQNFMYFCGADSVNVLNNGWITDDKGTGEFKFDAGVIANAYYEAYLYTGTINYKNIAISVGDYLSPLHFNLNYNYNTFVSLGLTRAFELTGDTLYLNRAVFNMRAAVFPGQTANGRWVDGHNADSRYHSLILQNVIPAVPLLPASCSYKTDLETMTLMAVRNMVEYSYSCGSATGYRWLMKAYGLPASVIPLSLKDSVRDYIGQHINQSAINGKYLDVPTMGEYLELLDILTGETAIKEPAGEECRVFPNPSDGKTDFEYTLEAADNIEITITGINGELIKKTNQGFKQIGTYHYFIDVSNVTAPICFITAKGSKHTFIQKIIIIK